MLSTDNLASLAPEEPQNLFTTTDDRDRAGDLSKDGSPSYQRAAKLSERLNSLLQGQSIMVQDWKYPRKYLRPSKGALQRRVTEKLGAWCSNTMP